MVMALLALPAGADIDESAYKAGGAVGSERERQLLQREFAAQRAAEGRQAAAESVAAQQAATAARARAAARPYGERLTEQRCTVCHAAGNYTAKRHTWLYWRLVVARMVWINEAPVAPAERVIIADHLAAVYPAAMDEQTAEYGLPLMTFGMLAGAAWVGRRVWARHLTRIEGEGDEGG
jgi:hypothetical protein